MPISQDTQASSESREATVFLRERYLYFISSMCGKNADIKMYENTDVSCKIKACDMNFENILVENVKTPLPEPLPHAILRTSDIVNITLKD